MSDEPAALNGRTREAGAEDSAQWDADASRAYRAYREGRAVLAPLPDLGPLRATGADRVEFLHGQVTNDVRGLPEGGTGEGLLLNHKGHALAQLRTLRRRDDLYLAVEGGASPLVREHLDRHIVFDDVQIKDLTGEIVAWTLQGATAAVDALLAELGADRPAPGASVRVPLDQAAVLVVASRRSGAGGVDLHLLARQAEVVRDRLVGAGAVPAQPVVLPLLRVVAGIPHATSEAGEGVLPQEAGLEPLVSYRKGCYLGQEIMARIEARGTVRRALRGVRLEGEPEHDEVEAAGRSVGRLGTSVPHPELGWIALAVVRSDLSDDARPSFGGIAGNLADLPFEPPPA